VAAAESVVKPGLATDFEPDADLGYMVRFEVNKSATAAVENFAILGWAFVDAAVNFDQNYLAGQHVVALNFVGWSEKESAGSHVTQSVVVAA